MLLLLLGLLPQPFVGQGYPLSCCPKFRGHLFDQGPDEQGRRFGCRSSFRAEPPGMLSGGAARRLPAGESDPRDGSHRSQRFTTKTERADAFEIVKRTDLRGRVPDQCQRQLVAGDAAAVVNDANQLDAAFLELDLEGRAAGVEGIFQQFLEYRGRPIDDFAGSDLADQAIGQEMDAGGSSIDPFYRPGFR